jgi:hypothetical protein
MIRNKLMTLLAAAALAAGLCVTSALAGDPSAPTPFGNVTLACDAATFSYLDFGSGPNTIHEQVFVDGSLAVDKTFTFSGSSGTDVVPLNLTGTHTLSATAVWTVDGGGRIVGELDTFDCGTPIFPVGGTFVVGDLTVGPVAQSLGKSVDFWGAQWWKLNALSGGDGPAEFKGFEDSPAMPACGDNWTTRPGNSTPPPDTIPAYMAIVVSSQVKNSGSSIGGDVLHLVIVKTDPGYQGNPGHAGTGTIVSVIC